MVSATQLASSPFGAWAYWALPLTEVAHTYVMQGRQLDSVWHRPQRTLDHTPPKLALFSMHRTLNLAASSRRVACASTHQNAPARA